MCMNIQMCPEETFGNPEYEFLVIYTSIAGREPQPVVHKHAKECIMVHTDLPVVLAGPGT